MVVGLWHWRLGQQGDREGRPFADFAFDLDVTAVQIDELLH